MLVGIMRRSQIMKKLFFILSITISFSGCGQDNFLLKDYENDFLKAANSDLTEKGLDSIFDKHSNLIYPQQGATQLMNNLQGINTKYSPLIPFKERKAYKDNIEKLLNSKNSMQRILAYITIGSAADNTYDNVLLDRLKTETSEGCLTWAAMCLFYNHSKSTDELLDFLVKHEDFGDAHFISLYLQLDQTKLKETSWKNINSDNKNAQIISLQTLSSLDKSSKVDSLIIQSIRNWDNDYKGYAIASLFQRDNVEKYEILKPYLDEEKTRNISIQVLEKSKFQSDKDKIEKLKKEKKWD
jgi:hypothetical protein